MFPTLCMHPPELSVRDAQLIQTTTTTAAAAAGGGKRRLKELVAALFRQLLHHDVNIWKVIQIMGERGSLIMVLTRI